MEHLDARPEPEPLARPAGASRRPVSRAAATRQPATCGVAAWERADVPALLELPASDARFTMPPLPAWFLALSLRAGRTVEIAGFLDPGLHRYFGLPEEVSDRAGRRSAP